MESKEIFYDWMQFGSLKLNFIGDVRHDKWEVVEDFKFAIDRTNDVITIPKGFVTDLASIPRIAYTFFPRSVKFDLAGCVHDYLYSIGYKDRKVSDLIMKDILKLIFDIKRIYNQMYYAVRIGGRNRYGKH